MLVDDDPWTKLDAISSAIAAGATCLGVIFAGIGGVIAYMLYNREANRDLVAEERVRRADAFQRRQQASAVGFWYTEEGRWKVANLSSLPIYKVALGHYPARHREVWCPPVLDGRELSRVVYSALGPNQSLDFKPAATEPVIAENRDIEMVLVFTDNAGISWARRRSRLTELSDGGKAENPLMVDLLMSLERPDEDL